MLHTPPPAPNNSGLAKFDCSGPPKAVPKPGANPFGMVARGADSIEDHESVIPIFVFCEILLRMLLAELTREWPRLLIWAGELRVPVGRPAGKCDETDDCGAGASFQRLERDWRRSIEAPGPVFLGVRRVGVVASTPGPDPMGFCLGW